MIHAVKKAVRFFSTCYLFIRLLSLDIVAGVLAGAMFSQGIFAVELPVLFWVTLPSAVWIIYISDHIIDGYNNPGIKKYRFYVKNQRFFIGTGIFLGLLNVVFFILFYDQLVLKYGIALSFLVIGYFVWSHFAVLENKFIFPKEIYISFVYVVGVFGYSALLKGSVNNFQMLCVLSYLFIIMGNIFFYSVIEVDTDIKMNKRTAATINGVKITRYFFFASLGFSVISALILFVFFKKSEYMLLFTFMSAILALLMFYQEKYIRKEVCGSIADAILILPVTVL